MIREWADEDTNERIDEALTPQGRDLAATWDDEDAWAQFQEAMTADRRRN
jgi:hypothetical protein